MTLVSSFASYAAPTVSTYLAADKKGGSSLGFLLPLVLFVVFAILVVKSRRNRGRTSARGQQALMPGAEIVTRAGMLGTLVEAGPEEVLIEVAPGVRLRMLAGAIAPREQPGDRRSRTKGAQPDGTYGDPPSSPATESNYPPRDDEDRPD